MNQVVKITGVFTQSGQNSRGEWTRWDVKDAGGNKYQTFQEGLGKRAEAHKGQSVEITYHVESKNGYDNNVIDAIKAIDGPVNAESASSAPAQQDPRTVTEPERQLRIMRQSALDRAISTAAAGIVTDLDVDGLFRLADVYIGYFENGVKELEGIQF